VTSRFSPDNTKAYDATALTELNAAWQQITSHSAYSLDHSDDLETKSMLDSWSETLLAEYDAGKRGKDLTAWFYADVPFPYFLSHKKHL
jgi:hypothetical protein